MPSITRTIRLAASVALVATSVIPVRPAAAAPTLDPVVQVGAVGHGLAWNDGITGSMQVALPQVFADASAAFFWIGEYLEFGEFIHIGWGTHGWSCSGRGDRGFLWAAVFDVNGALDMRADACGTSGPGGTRLKMSMLVGDTWIGGRDWFAFADGAALPDNRFRLRSRTAGPNLPMVVAELSQENDVPVSLANDLGPARFPGPAMRARIPWLGRSVPPVFGSAYRWGPCPPYGIAVGGENDLTLGKGKPCRPAGDVLWTSSEWPLVLMT